MVAQLYRRPEDATTCPAITRSGRTARARRGIQIEEVIGGPAFRISHSDHLLQIADLIAHALLKQEDPAPTVEHLGIERGLLYSRPGPQPKAVVARSPGYR